MPQDKSDRLRDSIVTACIEKLDAPGLKAHLDSVSLDEGSASKLVDIVLRQRTLVFRYPGDTKKRTAILDAVLAKVLADVDADAARRARERFDLFDVIDGGYAGLRSLIGQLPLAALPVELSFSAYLRAVAKDWATLQSQIEAALPDGMASGSIIITTPEGDRFGADAATAQTINLLSMNVTLSAYQGRWFDDEGIVRIPPLAEATKDQIEKAGLANRTAFAWQQWQSVEERARYLGGELARASATADPFPEGAELITHRSRSLGWEVQDLAMNERLGERLAQTFKEMAVRTNLFARAKGVEPGTAMPPGEFVSAAEGHSCVLLSEYLGLNVATNPAELGGLRLAEWIRGFAVLQQLAQDLLQTQTDVCERAFPRLELRQLEEVLTRNGLSPAKARVFIDQASFTRSSRDLYDAPILREGADGCRLVVPGLLGALLLRLVLSTLANKELVVEGKGDAFEAQFRRQLSDQKLPVYHIKAKRDGEQYEYDAVVPWGDYLFVFECKNRSISGTNPIASYNVLRTLPEHIDQVHRLVDGLRRHPDILTQNVREDCTSLTIVPVVMSSMPLSLQGDVDGVYFSDASATGRFFQERRMHISRLHQVGDAHLLHRVPTLSQWAGETPDAEDFLRHLRDPLPLRVMMAHLTVEPFVFQIGPGLFAATDRPERTAMSMASLAALAGLSEADVLAEMDRVTVEEVEPLRAALNPDKTDPA